MSEANSNECGEPLSVVPKFRHQLCMKCVLEVPQPSFFERFERVWAVSYSDAGIKLKVDRIARDGAVRGAGRGYGADWQPEDRACCTTKSLA